MMLVPLARRLMVVQIVNQPSDREQDSSNYGTRPYPSEEPDEVVLWMPASETQSFFIMSVQSTIGGWVYFLNIGVTVEELTRDIHICLPEPLLEDCPEAIKHDLAKAGGNQSIGTKTDIWGEGEADHVLHPYPPLLKTNYHCKITISNWHNIFFLVHLIGTDKLRLGINK